MLFPLSLLSLLVVNAHALGDNTGYSRKLLIAASKTGRHTSDMLTRPYASGPNEQSLRKLVRPVATSKSGDLYVYWPEPLDYHSARRVCESDGGIINPLVSAEDFTALSKYVSHRLWVWNGWQPTPSCKSATGFLTTSTECTQRLPFICRLDPLYRFTVGSNGRKYIVHSSKGNAKLAADYCREAGGAPVEPSNAVALEAVRWLCGLTSKNNGGANLPFCWLGGSEQEGFCPAVYATTNLVYAGTEDCSTAAPVLCDLGVIAPSSADLQRDDQSPEDVTFDSSKREQPVVDKVVAVADDQYYYAYDESAYSYLSDFSDVVEYDDNVTPQTVTLLTDGNGFITEHLYEESGQDTDYFNDEPEQSSSRLSTANYLDWHSDVSTNQRDPELEELLLSSAVDFESEIGFKKTAASVELETTSGEWEGELIELVEVAVPNLVGDSVSHPEDIDLDLQDIASQLAAEAEQAVETVDPEPVNYQMAIENCQAVNKELGSVADTAFRTACQDRACWGRIPALPPPDTVCAYSSKADPALWLFPLADSSHCEAIQAAYVCDLGPGSRVFVAHKVDYTSAVSSCNHMGGQLADLVDAVAMLECKSDACWSRPPQAMSSDGCALYHGVHNAVGLLSHEDCEMLHAAALCHV